jgi:hypothetical protein
MYQDFSHNYILHFNPRHSNIFKICPPKLCGYTRRDRDWGVSHHQAPPLVVSSLIYVILTSNASLINIFESVILDSYDGIYKLKL